MFEDQGAARRARSVVVLAASALAVTGVLSGPASAASMPRTTAGVGVVAPSFVPDPEWPPVGATPGRPKVVPRLLCTSWTFVPLASTTCHRGTIDHPLVRRVGSTWFRYGPNVHRWVVIPYTWNHTRQRLEIDGTKIDVRQPPVGVESRVWRWACSAWTLQSEAGPTLCRTGSAHRVWALFTASGAPAQIKNPTTGVFEPSAYRWNRHGGYLELDARLVPVATVDLGPSMSPRPSDAVTDYVVQCPGGSLEASVVARAGGVVIFDGQELTAPGTVSVALSPGQAVRWTTQRPGLPVTTHQARCLPDDFPTWTASGPGTTDGQTFLLTPALVQAGAPPLTTKYVVAVDARGTPVWWRPTSTYTPIDAKVLPSGDLAVGETGVTFSQTSTYHTSDWAGHDGPSIGTGAGLDHHDLQPTADGGYLAIRYVFRDCLGAAADCVDMTAYGGSSTGTVIDCEVVKLTANGDVAWVWKARDHIGQDEWVSPGRLDIDGHDYWDVDHVNSVEDDGDGVIVSFRQLDAVYRIRTSDGGIDWKLGGTTTAQSLAVTGSTGSVIVAQHDARRLPGGHLMVFDNGTFEGRAPRALELAVDPTARTAAVVREVTDARVATSGCCGSARVLLDGSWLIAWGGTRWVTVVDPQDRTTLSLDLGQVFSYRATPIPAGLVTQQDLSDGMDAMHPRP